MQTETIDKSQQATPSIDEELIDTLIAISVVAKRLAANLRQQNTENGGKQDSSIHRTDFHHCICRAFLVLQLLPQNSKLHNHLYGDFSFLLPHNLIYHRLLILRKESQL